MGYKTECLEAWDITAHLGVGLFGTGSIYIIMQGIVELPACSASGSFKFVSWAECADEVGGTA